MYFFLCEVKDRLKYITHWCVTLFLGRQEQISAYLRQEAMADQRKETPRFQLGKQ